MKRTFTPIIKEYLAAEIFEDADRKLRALNKINALNLNTFQKAAFAKEAKKLRAELAGKSLSEIKAICEQWQEDEEGLNKQVEPMDEKKSIRAICEQYGLTQATLANRFGIPLRTVEQWCTGRRQAPSYVVSMIKRILELEKENTGV